jgi:hypothetical protein
MTSIEVMEETDIDVAVDDDLCAIAQRLAVERERPLVDRNLG